MRIIRNLVILVLIFAPVTPNIALAAGEISSNETKINLEINKDNLDNLLVDNGVVKNKVLANIPYSIEGYLKVKSPREIEVETILAKYSNKRKNYSYPQGKFVINASAYTAAADECGKSDGITASGLKVLEGETIACPPQFPLGTKLNIEGIGTRICEDRGGAIKGNHVDIYVESKKDAFEFGRQNLMAEIAM
jgi:3D (Asp-Asp-Asp) domain-containing protein